MESFSCTDMVYERNTEVNVCECVWFENFQKHHVIIPTHEPQRKILESANESVTKSYTYKFICKIKALGCTMWKYEKKKAFRVWTLSQDSKVNNKSRVECDFSKLTRDHSHARASTIYIESEGALYK